MAFHALGHSFSPIQGVDFVGILPVQPVILEDVYHDILTGYRLEPTSPGQRTKRFAVNNESRGLANLVAKRR
jgi:hypothetical protein